MTESSAGQGPQPAPQGLADVPQGQVATAPAPRPDLPDIEPKSSVEELFESLEPLLLEIRNDVDANRTKSESTAVSLEQMTGELAEMRAQIASMTRTIVKSSKGYADVCAELRRVQTAASATHRDGSRSSQRASIGFVVGAALILISWALLLYFKTGQPWPALAALVSANLTGWLVIMISRMRA